MMKRSDGGRQVGCHEDGRCWFSSSLRWFSTISVVKREVERAGLMTIVYRRDSTGSCSEVKVGVWLRRRRSGEEQRIIIADQHVSRGWEASHILVVDLRGSGMETLSWGRWGAVLLTKDFGKEKIGVYYTCWPGRRMVFWPPPWDQGPFEVFKQKCR